MQSLIFLSLARVAVDVARQDGFGISARLFMHKKLYPILGLFSLPIMLGIKPVLEMGKFLPTYMIFSKIFSVKMQNVDSLFPFPFWHRFFSLSKSS